MIEICGTVTKTAQPKMLTYRKDMMCSKCRYTFPVTADYNQFYELVPPLICPNPEGCSNNQFGEVGVVTADNCRDYQEVKLQEQVGNLHIGVIPRSIWVTLEDDLVD